MVEEERDVLVTGGLAEVEGSQFQDDILGGGLREVHRARAGGMESCDDGCRRGGGGGVARGGVAILEAGVHLVGHLALGNEPAEHESDHRKRKSEFHILYILFLIQVVYNYLY